LRERIGIGRPAAPAAPGWVSPDALRMLDQDQGTILGRAPAPLERGGAHESTWQRLLRNVPRDLALSIDPAVTQQRLLLTFPMMDHRVIQLAGSLPPIPWRQRKFLIREAFKDLLPDEVLRRPKTPVSGLDATVVEGWRRAHLAAALRSTPSAPIDAWIDRRCWHMALEHGTPREARAAWRVLMLDGWLRAKGGAE